MEIPFFRIYKHRVEAGVISSLIEGFAWKFFNLNRGIPNGQTGAPVDIEGFFVVPHDHVFYRRLGIRIALDAVFVFYNRKIDQLGLCSVLAIDRGPPVAPEEAIFHHSFGIIERQGARGIIFRGDGTDIMRVGKLAKLENILIAVDHANISPRARSVTGEFDHFFGGSFGHQCAIDP